MKEFVCYQWLIIDHQQLHYPYFIITKRHYKNRADVDKDYSPKVTESCFRPIRPIKESKLTGELAEMVYEVERRHK